MSEVLAKLKIVAGAVSMREPYEGYLDEFIQTIDIISRSKKLEAAPERKFQQATREVVDQELDELRHCASALAACLRHLHGTTRQCLWDGSPFKYQGNTALTNWNYVFEEMPLELYRIVDGVRRANKKCIPGIATEGRPIENRNRLAARICASFYLGMTGKIPNKSRKPTGFLPLLQAVFDIIGSDASARATVDALLKPSM